MDLLYNVLSFKFSTLYTDINHGPASTTSNHPWGANPPLSQHRWAQNMFSDLVTLTVNLDHSKSIGFLGPIRSYIEPRLKFIS